MYEKILGKILSAKESADKGERQNIPYPFEKLNEYLGGIDKGQAIGVLGGTGIGKSKFVRYVFIYHLYKFWKETGYKLRVPFFAMEDSAERVWYFMICHYLFDHYDISISHKELLSRSRTLPDFVVEKLIEAKAYFAEFETIVTVVDGINEPSKIYDYCRGMALNLGKIIVTEVVVEGQIIKQYSYESDTHVIAIFDNMSNLESDDETSNEQKTILKFIKDYMRDKLCNRFHWSCIVVLQLDFESERPSFSKTGDNIAQKLEPTLASVGDSKRSTRSFHLVMSLFNPSRFDLLRYPIPPKDDPTNCYDIGLLGNTFRSLRVIKSNDSDVGMRVPLYFNGISEIFEEMPLPKTKELNDFYDKIRQKFNKPKLPESLPTTIFAWSPEMEQEEAPF